MALPTLPSLAVGAKTKTTKPAKKLVMVYVPNGLNRRGFFPGEENGVVPIGFKGGFSADKTKDQRIQNKPGIYPLELTSTLQPLQGNEKEITLITGMDRTYKNGRKRKGKDQTVEIVMHLGIDPKHADQMVRGALNMSFLIC